MGKFKIGDKVKVVNYGHRNYAGDEHDYSPEVVGQVGIVKEIILGEYALSGTTKAAWFLEDQLELVE